MTARPEFIFLHTARCVKRAGMAILLGKVAGTASKVKQPLLHNRCKVTHFPPDRVTRVNRKCHLMVMAVTWGR